MWPLLLTAALATPVERFPWQAEVQIDAPVEAIAIPLPPELRSLADPRDGSDLLVVDASGAEVPFALARETPAEEVRLRVRASTDIDVWQTEPLDRPIDGLVVDLPGSPWATTVTIERQEDGEWLPHAEGLVFTHPLGRDEIVRFAPTRASLRVRYHHHFTSRRHRTPHLRGLRDPRPYVTPTRLTLDVVDQRVREDGWAVYTVELPHDLPIRSVNLHTDHDLFDRAVHVGSTPLGSWTNPGSGGSRVRRIPIGDADVDLTEVPLPRGLKSDVMLLHVEAHGERPLEIDQVTVELEGKAILLHEVTAGALTVYGGAPAATRHVDDLQSARPELQRMAVQTVRPGPVTGNPSYEPVEVRTGVALPGGVLDMDGWTRSRTLTGEGLVHIDLPVDVLATARADRADLRLVDPEGRQVPYVLRRRSTPRATAPSHVRTEHGGISRIRVESPHANAPVASVTLHSATPLFERDVRVYRARGATLEPLRSHRWRGEDHPTTLTLLLDTPVGDELVVEIDNGDNPPLPLNGVELGLPDWEMVAVLPADTRLLYGQPRAQAPTYDLALVRGDLLHRAQATAIVGPEVKLTPAPTPLAQQAALFGGLALMVLALGAMTVQMVGEEPTEET
ncbi:MAG: hypothetical protein KC912_09265 [Proteobacteria bacterium]|nr:hypothetical protein [Pseudomonadota bacterium]